MPALDQEPETHPVEQSERSVKRTTGILSEADLRDLERENILAALDQTDWRMYGPGGAAELLGIRPTTLASRIKKMGLAKPD